MPRINTNATKIIEKVREEFGYTFSEMAQECGVATGSIQRWYSSSRAKADKIKALENLISNTRLPEQKIAENLIEIYWHIKKPITITYSQLRDISGRERLSESVIDAIEQALYERGFALINEADDEGKMVYFVIRKKWLAKKMTQVNRSILRAYYSKRVELEHEEEDD
jgi:transcriptional regulator with XRE-family HTH domain